MYKYKKLNRILVIFLLVTFLFLPFSKPKKTQAFAFAIPAIPWVAEAFLSVGATYMVCSGVYNFVNGIQMRHEARKLMEEIGGDLLYHCEEFDTWWTFEQMDADNWKKWDKKVKQKPGKETPTKIYGAIGSIIQNALDIGKDQQQEVSTEFPVKMVIDNYGTYKIEVVADGFYDYDKMNTCGTFKSTSEKHKWFNKEHSIKATFSNQAQGDWVNTSKISETSKYGTSLMYNLVTAKGGSCPIPYEFSYPEGTKVTVTTEVLYKENLLENANEETFKQNTENKVIDVSKVENVPSTATKPEEIPNLEITEDTNTDTGTDGGVDTGWKWLDNILNSILNAIRSIPSEVASFFVPETFIDLDLSPLYVNFKDKFPFCLPYDLYNLVSSFKADYVAPNWSFKIENWQGPFQFMNGYEFKVDLKDWSWVGSISRFICLAIWCVFLIFLFKRVTV